MNNPGLVVLVIFIAIRVLIAFGIVYLVFYEVRRLKRQRSDRNEEITRDVNGEDVDNSSGRRK